MTFEDVEQGNPLIITIKTGSKQATLESSTINVVDGCILADPFMSGGNIVSFPKNIDIELLVVRDADVPFYFQKVYIEQTKYHDHTCHLIRTNLPGIKYNRRSSFRVPITAPIKIDLGAENTINATLKDLSTGSYSILVDKKIELPLHKKITIQYSDQANQKYYELSGRPVRKSELQNYNLYGCILEKRIPDLDGYLAQKQLETRRNRPQ